MSKIVPKLNLNKTPQLVDNNSLVMAKNIRLLEDGTIGPDTSLELIETNIGDEHTREIHHEEIAEDVTIYQYTILDVRTSIIIAGGGTIDEEYLGDYAFDFSVDDEDPYDDNYKKSDKDKYVRYEDKPLIYCYDFRNGNIRWNSYKFRYDYNNNCLVNQDGLLFLLAIREDVYRNNPDTSLRSPQFVYLVLPKEYIGRTITILVDGIRYTYVVVNPVYQTTRIWHHVIQPEYTEIETWYDTVTYIAQIVGLDNKIYFFKESNYIKDSIAARAAIATEYPNEVFVGTTPESGQIVTFDVNSEGYVTRNGVLFQDSSIAKTLYSFTDRVKIFEYDEVNKTFKIIKCAWKYSGGTNIRGCVSVNSTGEYILTICESGFDYDILIPIKHINLSKCTEEDNESFYTQAPNIPISNLKLSGRYIKNIPAGVYQFFIRYKIHDNFYTTWFPCSKELFAATRKQIDTLQGTIKHADVHENSNNSFVFTIEHLFPEYCDNFEQYQLGFIVSSDDGVFARSWKHFDMNVSSTDSIYFEYNKDDIEEINIDELLKTNYDLFNVENVTQYKNRLYISNYKETDFNEDLGNLAKQIKVKLKLSEVSVSDGVYFNNIPLHQSTISGIYDSFGGTSIRETFRHSQYCNINTSEEVSDISSEYEVSRETYQNTHSHITKVYILYNDTKYYLYGGDNTDVDIEVETYDSNVIINRFIDEIKNKIIGIDSNGKYKYRYNPLTIIEINNIHVEYKTYTKRTKVYYEGPEGHSGSGRHVVIEYYLICYTYNVTDIITLKQSIISSSYKYNEYNTLLPFTKYDFYIHYIKQNGIVTNGYFIGTKEITRYCKGYTQVTEGYPSRLDAMTELYSVSDLDDLCFYSSNNEEYAYYDNELTSERTYYRLIEETDGQSIIYPSFTNIKCPEGYIGCFISICKYGNNVAQGFNYEYNSNNSTHKIDCLELDTLLYNIQSNIKIRASNGVDVTKTAVYYSSSTTNPVKHLGCSGHIEFTKSGAIDTKCWIILDSINKPYNKTLQKLTPYIKLNPNSDVNYNNYIDLNSPGYYCEVIKLNRQFCDAEYEDENNNPTGYYVSGTDIYTRDITSTEIKLQEITGKVDYHNSNVNYIFSNFNLNYVSLTNDLVPSVRRYDVVREGDAEEGTITSSSKQFITLVNSLTASFILELKSMYRDYTRKLYYEYTKNKITKFDNTIRVSSIDVDEIYRYIYRFEATDYYNVPTHRGIITNLVAVANTLYVHCEHSLFKFTDNKTIDAQDEQVVLQENDIFNSGISEVFDAQYGYAGLQNREQSLITYNAYVFYDAVAKIIYAFGGEQQIGNISEPIKKLIKALDPTDVQFVGDELHNRFFVNLINESGNVCLSFNFGSKSFIAIHDITFKFGFHSRRHTYFVHDNMYNGDKIGWSIYRIADTIDGNFIAYQNCYEPSLIQIADCDNVLLNPVKSVNACVDIIINTEYEKIKQLDYISWICSEILEYGNDQNLVAEEVLNRKYPGSKLRIYSDSTQSDLFELLKSDGNAKISNEERNVNGTDEPSPNPNSWQYPQYNCGVWSMNYFRDILNTGDIFHYKASKNKITGGSGHSKTTNLTPKIQRENLTQESSLIYGKYFVLRFIFNNKNFKLENVMLKMNDYGKTK